MMTMGGCSDVAVAKNGGGYRWLKEVGVKRHFVFSEKSFLIFLSRVDSLTLLSFPSRFDLYLVRRAPFRGAVN